MTGQTSVKALVFEVCAEMDAAHQSPRDIPQAGLSFIWKSAAHQYVRQYRGDDTFLRDVAARIPVSPVMSNAQVRVVLQKMLIGYRGHLQRTATNALATVAQASVPAPEAARPAAPTQSVTVPAPRPQVPVPPAREMALQSGVYTTVLDDGHLTLKVQPTGERVEGVKQCLSYLAGPSNEGDFVGFAWVRDDNTVVTWKRSRSSERLATAVRLLRQGDPSLVLESASCNRCGRTLTVPTSLHQGYGPECIKHV